MATATFSWLSLYLCLLCHGSMAQFAGPRFSPWQSPRQGAFRGCRFDRLLIFDPVRRQRSEAGVTEYFDDSNEQFQCIGVSVIRRVIEPQGLLVPRYSNAPGLVYIIQGSGLLGLTFPGCPATYQHQLRPFVRSQGQTPRDEHQKIHLFGQGDVVVLPAGVVHWFLNNGDSPVIALYVFDVNNNANQLAPRHKDFLLAGNNQRLQQMVRGPTEQHSGQNILSGFTTELLSDALAISLETARRLKNQNDQRGEIIRVPRGGIQLPNPPLARMRQQSQQQQGPYSEDEQPRPGFGQCNGLDENFCTVKARINIDDPDLADTFNPRTGSITRLNSQKLDLLSLVQMSATRVNLNQNAIIPPSWNINAHSVVYMIQGRAEMQVVDHHGRRVFDAVLRPGQLLIVPQHYAVAKKAMREGCQFIAFNTNLNAMASGVAGKSSVFRGLPVDVIANAYGVSREEARSIKDNRGHELGAFESRVQMQGRRYGRRFQEGGQYPSADDMQSK
ncbi:hypothetical protein ACP4OV_009187 [Aristida adscensionis]